jgi:arginyl-tRNA synthetase
MIKNVLEKQIEEALGKKITLKDQARFGDYFVSPSDVSLFGRDLSLTGEQLASNIFASIKEQAEKSLFENGYVNIYLKKEVILTGLETMEDIGSFTKKSNKDKVIIFDYSQPNIAKPFSVGHLRSTIIGQANYNIHKFLGYKTIGINHIGDWGTQFGKLIYAVKTWGNPAEIEADPINQLVNLYQKFHREAEVDPNLNEAAAEWFRKLELHDEEATELWKKCILWSFAEFNRLYSVLNIKIDETIGESFYADKTDAVISELKDKGLLVKSEGAQIVELENMPPAIIQKTNESTLYLTRDLAAVKYRIEKYQPDEIIYHVGNDQYLHFQQLFAVIKKLGWSEKTKLTFAGHGMIRLEDGKMSTRAGRVVLLNDLIVQAKQKALQIIDAKNPELKDKNGVAQKIGLSAIKYADLATNRKSDIVFSFDKMISLKGNSGPYLQYSYARSSSILRKFVKQYPDLEAVADLPDEGLALAREMLGLGGALDRAADSSNPNIVCDFAYKMAVEFNNYYEKKKIVTDDPQQTQKNIYLIKAFQGLLGNVFDLIGLSRLEDI